MYTRPCSKRALTGSARIALPRGWPRLCGTDGRIDVAGQALDQLPAEIRFPDQDVSLVLVQSAHGAAHAGVRTAAQAQVSEDVAVAFGGRGCDDDAPLISA